MRVESLDVEPPRRTALEPPPEDEEVEPELPDPPDVLGGDDRGGGADRTGCDCGIDDVGASLVLEPALLDELEPLLGGASLLVVVVRGMA